MRLLLHICCAHCLDQTLVGLRHEFGDELVIEGYFYNPNIHPLIEFRKRLKAVKVINEALKLPIHYSEDYGLHGFMHHVWQEGKGGRCRRCYDERLKATAKMAYENGFTVFSSTLCVSPHQDHGDIRQAGEGAAAAWGADFIYRDLRPHAVDVPRRRGIYGQNYCGCIFSEESRFKDTKNEIYRGSGS